MCSSDLTFITPIDREQILGLINAMDDVLDLLQDATESMSLYDVRQLTEEVVRLADISVRCCERVANLQADRVGQRATPPPHRKSRSPGTLAAANLAPAQEPCLGWKPLRRCHTCRSSFMFF